MLGYGTTPGIANFSTAGFHSGSVTDDAANQKITFTYTRWQPHVEFGRQHLG
ncbi:MAG: hypothetical protein U1F77_00855 [Kiritimatiellia bacterium]